MRRKWIKYLNILLSFVVILLGVNFFFFLKPYKEDEQVSASTVSSLSPSFKESKRSLKDYSIISRRNLFNLKTPVQPRIVESKKDLSLKLKGTVVGGKKFSFCIIEDKKKRKENLYQIGDKLQNMEVTNIMEDSVILEDGNEKIILYIYEDAGEKGRTLATKSIPFDTGKIEHPSPNKWIVSKDYVQEASKNISKILSDIKIRPHFSGGRMQGFKVGSIKEESVASAVGIQKNDIIKKVNGEVINSPKKIFEFYRNMGKSNTIQLEIERDGETQVLTYEIKP